jgi:hypothetical protein
MEGNIMKTYTEAKIRIYYAAIGADQLKARVEKFLYKCTKNNLIIIKSRSSSYGDDTIHLYLNEIDDQMLNAIQYAVNSQDVFSHCEIIWKKRRKWRNPFKKFN